eukprot:5370852-Amphidinium_carterae.1
MHHQEQHQHIVEHEQTKRNRDSSQDLGGTNIKVRGQELRDSRTPVCLEASANRRAEITGGLHSQRASEGFCLRSLPILTPVEGIRKRTTSGGGDTATIRIVLGSTLAKRGVHVALCCARSGSCQARAQSNCC